MALSDSSILSEESVEMSNEAFASVNVPVSISSFILNIVFVFCMLFPQKGTERLKQPLKILLGILVGINIAAHVCISLTVFLSTFVKDFVFYIVVYTVMASITSSHWLNVFYCCQIISVQHPFFIWLKRKIKTIIYFALIVNTVLCLFGLSVTLTAMSILSNYENTTVTKIDWLGLSDTTQGVLRMGLSFFSFSLSVMLISSCLSVVYLWRHLRNMQESSSSFTSPHRQRPIKSTIRGIIVQALLHVICSFAVIINEILIKALPWNFDCNSNITCTIVSLYFFGTTINMGFIQSVFRERVVHVWQTIFQPHSLSRFVHTVSPDVLSG